MKSLERSQRDTTKYSRKLLRWLRRTRRLRGIQRRTQEDAGQALRRPHQPQYPRRTEDRMNSVRQAAAVAVLLSRRRTQEPWKRRLMWKWMVTSGDTQMSRRTSADKRIGELDEHACVSKAIRACSTKKNSAKSLIGTYSGPMENQGLR